ncbi:MAG: hypothetical protein ACLFQV_04105, partial [Vulcanimicrobiota bacterium]
QSLTFLFVFFLLTFQGLYARQNPEVVELKNRIIQLQNEGKLDMSEIVPCSRIDMYGAYDRLKDAEIEQNKTIFFYFEPINYFTRRENGKYSYHLVQDMEVTDSNGKVLLEKKGITSFAHTTVSPLFGIYFENSITIKGLEKGGYFVKITLHDELKSQNVTKKSKFTVINPE